jgi:hypothetical protein
LYNNKEGNERLKKNMNSCIYFLQNSYNDANFLLKDETGIGIRLNYENANIHKHPLGIFQCEFCTYLKSIIGKTSVKFRIYKSFRILKNSKICTAHGKVISCKFSSIILTDVRFLPLFKFQSKLYQILRKDIYFNFWSNNDK